MFQLHFSQPLGSAQDNVEHVERNQHRRKWIPQPTTYSKGGRNPYSCIIGKNISPHPGSSFGLYFAHGTVDGRNPASQLSLVVSPILYKVLYIPGGAGFLPSTVVSGFFLHGSSEKKHCLFGRLDFQGPVDPTNHPSRQLVYIALWDQQKDTWSSILSYDKKTSIHSRINQHHSWLENPPHFDGIYQDVPWLCVVLRSAHPIVLDDFLGIPARGRFQNTHNIPTTNGSRILLIQGGPLPVVNEV